MIQHHVKSFSKPSRRVDQVQLHSTEDATRADGRGIFELNCFGLDASRYKLKNRFQRIIFDADSNHST